MRMRLSRWIFSSACAGHSGRPAKGHRWRKINGTTRQRETRCAFQGVRARRFAHKIQPLVAVGAGGPEVRTRCGKASQLVAQSHRLPSRKGAFGESDFPEGADGLEGVLAMAGTHDPLQKFDRWQGPAGPESDSNRLGATTVLFGETGCDYLIGSRRRFGCRPAPDRREWRGWLGRCDSRFRFCCWLTTVAGTGSSWEKLLKK